MPFKFSEPVPPLLSVTLPPARYTPAPLVELPTKVTLPAPKRLSAVEILLFEVVVVVLAPVVITLVELVCESDKRIPEPCAPEIVPLSTKVPVVTLRLVRPSRTIPVPFTEFPLIVMILPLAVRLNELKAVVVSVELPLE